MQQALQQLALARTAWQPSVKEIEAVYQELNLEQELATITANALEKRVEALTEKLGRGEATEAELRAAMKSLRESPRMTGALNDRHQKLTATLTEFFELPLRADDVLPESIKSALNQSQPVQHPKQDPEFAIAWLESALQSRVELVSLTELGLPFVKALRVKEGTHPKGDLQASDLVVALLGEPIESLDQAVACFEAAKQPTSSDDRISIVMKGGLSGPRQNHLLRHLSNWAAFVSPGSSSGVRFRFEVKVQRGETIESESVSGVCVRPDGLIVIPIASNRLAPNTPILSNSRGATPVIVGSDDSHGLTLLKLSGPPRPWVKCWISQPMLDQELGYHQDGQGSWCQVTAVGCEYPKPLVGNDAFHIKLAQEGVAPERGGQLLTKEGALLGLVLEPLNDQSEKKNRYPSAVVIPAVHIQKLIDDYRQKSHATEIKQAAP